MTMIYSLDLLNKMPHRKRVNLLNAVSGIKPGHLIGTKSSDGISNLAVFSSIIHIGANPPLIGFILRPIGEVPRHTYENILDTTYYTINHIHPDDIKKAHQTSGKYDSNISEFDACHLEEEYIESFYAPFVKSSNVKIGLAYRESIPIEANGTILVIGEVQSIVVPEENISEEGYLDMSDTSVGVGGLNEYYTIKRVESLPYVSLKA